MLKKLRLTISIGLVGYILCSSGCLELQCEGFLSEPYIELIFSDSYEFEVVEVIGSRSTLAFWNSIEFPINPNENETTGVFISELKIDTLRLSYSVRTVFDIDRCGSQLIVENLEVLEGTTFNSVIFSGGKFPQAYIE